MEVLGDAAKEEEIIEGTNHSIAETIIENTTDKNQNILVMDSMQSVTSKGVEEGIIYLSIMESNLEEGEIITVEGIFDTYDEGSYTYCILRNASLL